MTDAYRPPEDILADLTDALQEVGRRSETYRARKDDASAARTAETVALNALNDAQKRADQLIEVFRDAAGGDWGKRKYTEVVEVEF